MADRFDISSTLTYTDGWSGTVDTDGNILLPSRTDCGTTQPVVLANT
jgi:hypothetical protein